MNINKLLDFLVGLSGKKEIEMGLCDIINKDKYLFIHGYTNLYFISNIN